MKGKIVSQNHVRTRAGPSDEAREDLSFLSATPNQAPNRTGRTPASYLYDLGMQVTSQARNIQDLSLVRHNIFTSSYG